MSSHRKVPAKESKKALPLVKRIITDPIVNSTLVYDNMIGMELTDVMPYKLFWAVDRCCHWIKAKNEKKVNAAIGAAPEVMATPGITSDMELLGRYVVALLAEILPQYAWNCTLANAEIASFAEGEVNCSCEPECSAEDDQCNRKIASVAHMCHAFIHFVRRDVTSTAVPKTLMNYKLWATIGRNQPLVHIKQSSAWVHAFDKLTGLEAMPTAAPELAPTVRTRRQ